MTNNNNKDDNKDDNKLKKSVIFGQCRPVTTYKKIGRIGEGTYGTVYKAIDKENHQLVALKRIIMHNEKHDGFPLTSIREISSLRQSDHPNCVKLLGIAVGHKRDGVFLVFEYCEHDLSTLLENVRSPFSESEIKSLVFQLLSALAFLHEHWIIHRDIKLSNLLYNNRGEVKLADFGLARTFPSHCHEMNGSFTPAVPMTQKVVTLWYRAPELLLGADAYTSAIDVWAVGCVFGELILGRPLIPGNDELDQVHRIFSLLGCPTSAIWPEVSLLGAFAPPQKHIDTKDKAPYALNLAAEMRRNPYSNLHVIFPTLGKIGLEFMNSLLTYDPNQRPSARKCTFHVYFSTSPYPKEPDLMPTFPSQHADIPEGGSDGEDSNHKITSSNSGSGTEKSSSIRKRNNGEKVGERRSKEKRSRQL